MVLRQGRVTLPSRTGAGWWDVSFRLMAGAHPLAAVRWTITLTGVALVVGTVVAGRVLAVVPAFSEPAENRYACVEGLLAPTVPMDVVVVDDGLVEPVAGRWRCRVRWVPAERG